MAGNKYLKKGTSGFPEEQAAIDTSAGAGDAAKIIAANSAGKVDETFLPPIVSTSAGVGDAGKLIETNGSGKLDETLLPAGVGADSKTITAAENLSAGDLVYLNASGQALKADANTVTKMAVGFVLASISSAASGTVYFDGTITGLTSLTQGAPYFLSAASAGAITATPPSGAGDIVQPIGWAVSATELTFNPGYPIIVA